MILMISYSHCDRVTPPPPAGNEGVGTVGLMPPGALASLALLLSACTPPAAPAGSATRAPASMISVKFTARRPACMAFETWSAGSCLIMAAARRYASLSPVSVTHLGAAGTGTELVSQVVS